MDTRNVNQAYENVIARLHAVRRQWWWLTLSEGLLKCIGILALITVSMLIVFTVSFQVSQSIFLFWVRIAVLLLVIGIAAYTLIRVFILPLCRRNSDAAVASRLESTQTENELASENRILSAVQLWKNLKNNRLGYAPEFIEHLILQTDQDMKNVQRRHVFQNEFRKIKRNAGIAVAGIGLLLITNFFLPNAFNGFAYTFQTLPKTLPNSQGGLNDAIHITDIEPGNTQIERGSDVNVAAQVSGHIGAPVTLHYRVGDGSEDTSTVEWQSLTMQPINGSEVPAYRGTLENVNRPLEYYIDVKGVTSTQYQVTISDEPVVTEFQYRLSFPVYTQLQPQTLPTNTGNIQTLFGTELTFKAWVNKPLTEAHLAFEESVDLPLDIATWKPAPNAQAPYVPPGSHAIRGIYMAKQTENYRIRITDAEGFTNRDPINYTLTVYKDTPPEVNIVSPARDTLLDNAMLVELEAEASDDYGIQELQLVYRIETEGAQEMNIPLKRWDVENASVRRSVSVAYTWDVDPIGIFPGETLAYYVQALDNDTVSGPNIGKSPTYTLRFPSLSELYDSVATEQETEQRGLEELVDEQADATGMIDTLLGKVRKRQELTFTDENLMQQVLENQKQIEQTAKQLVDDMKETAKEMEQNQLFDTETIQKYQELQNLMEKALSEEHKEILRKLSEALSKQQGQDQEQAMSEANLSQEQFLQQLERAKSLYEQILLQQELEAAAKQAKALAEQQKALMDTLEASLDSAPANELAEKEDRIGDEFGKLSEKLDTLGTEMQELAENSENAPPQIGRIADEIKRLNQFTQEYKLPETLEATSENLRSGQNSEALESGREAEQTLTELAQGLDNAMAFMEGANANETLTVMREAVESALHLSHLHEEAFSKTSNLRIASQIDTYNTSEVLQLQKLAADEISTAEGVLQLSSKLWELGNRQIEVPPEVVWHLNASNDALSRAARALEDRQPTLATPIQRSALADINQAIFGLLDAMAQMNQQMGASGMENLMEQLQQLAEGQEQLNQMAQNLSQQMREQGQTPGFEQMMRQLATQQQLIREATERLAERAEKMAQMLGSLDGVAEDMTEVERALQQGELNEQVLNRQQQILTRMLDSLTSLQKRDVGKQRKGEVAKKPETSVQEVPPLHPELLEIVRKLETTPNAKELENIPFQYREQLRRYFKALSQKTQ